MIASDRIKSIEQAKGFQDGAVKFGDLSDLKEAQSLYPMRIWFRFKGLFDGVSVCQSRATPFSFSFVFGDKSNFQDFFVAEKPSLNSVLI
jgi:hypothetical protein